jgi:exopolyphosphatase/guanosine-5'-triphosphate,3'-diphosphate pyrophosphatase
MTTPPMTTPIAAIDVGSNTIHLVVARPIAAATDLGILADETVLVRLGADVTATGAIGAERAATAIGVVRQQVETARRLGASPILGVATEGVRKASNSAAFVQQARGVAGVELTLISGEQEAAFTYWGATSGQTIVDRSAVVDLGGGSTEIVVGDAASIAWRISLPLGSGTIHDRVAPADPADPAELAAAAQVVEDALRPLDPPLPVSEVTACGGTATTLVWLARRALDADAVAANEASEASDASDYPATLGVLTPAVLKSLLAVLQSVPASAVAERYGVEVGRARLLAAGAVVLQGATRRLGAERMRVSRRGIREGAILAYARHGAGWLKAAARG